MSVTVKYLGIIEQTTGKSEESVEKHGPLNKVLEFVLDRYPALKELYFVVSHNGLIIHGNKEITGGDQITLIPPAPGG